MAVSVWTVYADGHAEPICDVIAFEDAVGRAIDLAEKYGSDAGNGHGLPKSVVIKRGSTVVLLITVIRGGLLKPKDALQ